MSTIKCSCGLETDALAWHPIEMPKPILAEAAKLFSRLAEMPEEERIPIINALRLEIHKYSPFRSEPVDCVQWIPSEMVEANDYNPNTVAPPEMKLLEISIEQDGYTQPIVAWKKKKTFEVVDGFHRNRVGKESLAINRRVLNHLPLSIINTEKTERGSRIASTIRHNRARGKHQVDAMSDIVIELKRRNWSNERICRDLGMDPDEILRLCQITGLQELFSDQEFSKSWDVEGAITEDDFRGLTDDASAYPEEETDLFRTVNTSDPTRIFHTYDKWECYKAGFYATKIENMTQEQCEKAYREFLSDLPRFAEILEHVITEWKHSCEHYLTNAAMNRIAWLGQAAACYALGIPSTYRSGFGLLTESQQESANQVALSYLNKWLEANGRSAVTMEQAYSGDRQSDIY